MRELYSEADVLLHPARCEPYGVVVLEAMASGLTVIASDATAAAVDRIEGGVNGFLHISDDGDDLALRIRDIADRPDRLAGIGAAARKTADAWPSSRAVRIIRELAERLA
jgi:starch synthase